MTGNPSEDRHKAKMAKRKAVQDAEVAAKTIEKGLLIVHTGTGKGKSTAAFGLAAARARPRLARRRRAVRQGRLGDGRARRASSASATRSNWHTMGEGFTWETQDRARDVAAASAPGRRRSELMADPTHPPAHPRRAQHRAALRLSAARRRRRGRCAARRPDPHVVVTGRNAKPELIEAADLVTEMTLVKHHFAAGVKAQEGIEF